MKKEPYASIEDNSFEDRPYPLARYLRGIRRNSATIFLTLAVIGFLYAIAASAYIFAAQSQRSITVPFRLEFQGAERGTYPNGTKFSSAEIVSTPVLTRVFQRNGLSRFMSFRKFSESIFVVESNQALEELSREYASRLADPKLATVDRYRLEAEYRDKQGSLARNEYAISYAPDDDPLPRSLAIKAVSDILPVWVELATAEKGVLRYQLSVLSTNVLNRSALTAADPVVALDILRTRIESITRNIMELESAPGARVRRGGRDKLSLAEIRLSLSDLVRFRVEPLLFQLGASRATSDPAATIRYLESQRTHNERQADAANQKVASLRDAMQLYMSRSEKSEATNVLDSGATNGDGVAPQLSDSFLDRLIQMTSNGQDIEFRQEMVSDIERESLAVLPFTQEVKFYDELLAQMRAGTGVRPDAVEIDAEMQRIREELTKAIQHVNAIYDLLSLNLNPSTVLYTATAPPIARTERAVSPIRLALGGLLLLLISLPIILAFVLVRERIRQEEAAELPARFDPAPAASRVE